MSYNSTQNFHSWCQNTSHRGPGRRHTAQGGEPVGFLQSPTMSSQPWLAMEGLLPPYGGFSGVLGRCMSSRVGSASCLILQEASKGTCGAGPLFMSHHCQSPRAKHWERLRPLTGVLAQQHVIEVPGWLPGSTWAGLEAEEGSAL